MICPLINMTNGLPTAWEDDNTYLRLTGAGPRDRESNPRH